MFDDYFSNPFINLHREKIHHKTVLNVLRKYEISEDVDLLSEDTDYADYWIIEKILTKYQPKVLIHEVNQELPDKCVVVNKSDDLVYWDGFNYHGASVCAFYCLAKKFNYSMIYCEKSGVNCFWIRNDLIEMKLNFSVNLLQNILNPKFLYKKLKNSYKNSTGKTWTYVNC